MCPRSCAGRGQGVAGGLSTASKAHSRPLPAPPALGPVSGARKNRKLETPHERPGEGRGRILGEDVKRQKHHEATEGGEGLPQPCAYRTEDELTLEAETAGCIWGHPVQAWLVDTPPPRASQPATAQLTPHLILHPPHGVSTCLPPFPWNRAEPLAGFGL